MCVLSILIDSTIQPLLAADLPTIMQRSEVRVEYWKGASVSPVVGIDAVVAGAERLEVAMHLYGGGVRRPNLVAATAETTVTATRELLRSGVDSVLNVSCSNPMEQALAIMAAATGYCVLPAGHGPELAHRLSEPPRSLTASEEQLLGLATSMTIEAAGAEIGLSRRQAQRRFKALCDDLGFPSHLLAATSAARWGIGDTT